MDVVTFVLLGRYGLMTDPVDPGAEVGLALGVEAICVGAVDDGIIVVDVTDSFNISIGI